MAWRILRDTVIFLAVGIVFVLILLLPREMEIEYGGGILFTASYPFSLELYKENIRELIDDIKIDKGFGTTAAGTPLIEHVQRYIVRSLKIVLPAFIISLVIGTVLGILLFTIRHKKRGRILTFITEMIAAIPDFFLFISIQYLLIILMHRGFPKFALYSTDEWYSFIIPCLSLTIFPLFHMIRVAVTTMNHEAGEDYVQTALAKGMTQRRVVGHVFANAWRTIVNQAHMIMLYILSSLPIIEKLANYHGAGYQLLESVLNNEHLLALLFFLPFFFMMYLTVILAQLARGRLPAKEVSDL